MLNYNTLQYITIHYNTIHYITLHYITLHITHNIFYIYSKYTYFWFCIIPYNHQPARFCTVFIFISRCVPCSPVKMPQAKGCPRSAWHAQVPSFPPIPQRHHRSLVGSATVWPKWAPANTTMARIFCITHLSKSNYKQNNRVGCWRIFVATNFLALEQTGNEVSYGSYNEINVLVARLHSTSGFHVSSARGCVFSSLFAFSHQFYWATPLAASVTLPHPNPSRDLAK